MYDTPLHHLFRGKLNDFVNGLDFLGTTGDP